MERTLPRSLDWRRILIVSGLALVAICNVVLLANVVEHFRYGEPGRDYFETLVPVVGAENPYRVPYLWSPLAVPILALVVPFGFGLWTLLHGIALLLIRPWWVAAVVGLSWPFWWDVASGNVGVFVFVAAWTALRGSKVGMAVYLVLCLLMPRPLMLPVMAWLLWKEPWTRVPFLGAAVAQVGVVGTMGLLDDWVLAVTHAGGAERLVDANLSASRWIGYPLWAAIFLPLAAWLTYRGRLGLASLAISPYLFPLYLLMGFLELRQLLPARTRGVHVALEVAQVHRGVVTPGGRQIWRVVPGVGADRLDEARRGGQRVDRDR